MKPLSLMNAALFHQPGVVTYEEIPTPSVEAGELLVKIGAALTCGTDVKSWKRGHPVLLSQSPSPFGHEFSGTVVAVGEGVTLFQEGDRVVAANSAPCYQCYFCKKGNQNLCESLKFLNGAYAEYIKIPAQIVSYNTYRLSDHLSFQVGAFTEPLAVALRGIEMCNISSGDQVAILGLGAIGQLLVKIAKWKGATVTAMARSPYKLEVAKRFAGADETILLENDWQAEDLKAKHSPEGRGFDVVIEAIGLPETWEKSIELVRPGGTVNLFAGCEAGTHIQIDTRKLHYQEITLLSLFHHTPYYVKKALDLLSTCAIDPAPLISETLPMASFLEA
ncbi:MAG: alcohol dehydrogenase catalytic domain-containing protein, partial [Cyanobacteria bacterium]|nr:alcohol dehydrogenase catalytic domain-containing protein [Cyanobacteriota bacterium]